MPEDLLCFCLLLVLGAIGDSEAQLEQLLKSISASLFLFFV